MGSGEIRGKCNEITNRHRPSRSRRGGGKLPFRIAFSPDGSTLALGYEDIPVVQLFDGYSLAQLPSATLDGLNNGWLSSVAFSRDGKTLYAGGAAVRGSRLLAWTEAGRGGRRVLPAGTTIGARMLRNTRGTNACLHHYRGNVLVTISRL
jgi:WD40 repeat protein